MSSSEDITARPVIRDRRRIDPVTGQVRKPDLPGDAGPAQADAAGPAQADAARPAQAAAGTAGGTAAGESPSGRHAAPGSDQPGDGAAAGELAAARTQLAERTADLQRLQAEYANYRKRVERDRLAVREQALANVLGELLPVLDDIGRAREHGELSGGFKSVADSLESAAAKLGLVSYAEKGDPFDPVVHEALMHSYSTEVSQPTCVQILQPGYKIGDRILRPARVAVAEPGEPDTSERDGTSPQEVPADGNG